MPIELINPMLETSAQAAAPAPRLAGGLAGRTIALLDISKPGGSHFLDRIEQLLRTRYGAASVVRAMKPTYAKPAPPDVLERLRSVDAVIEALAD